MRTAVRDQIRGEQRATHAAPGDEQTARSTPPFRELLGAGIALLALTAAAYGSHALDGGFYYDDWANAANTHHPRGGGGFLGALEYFADLTAYRPTLVLYVPLTHAVFGTHMGVHLAWAAGLAALASLTLYWLLRVLRVERLHAGVIAALVLVFPFSDATRMWATASVVHLAIAFYLAGVGVAVLGLRASGRRSGRLHAGAVALYLLSLWTYEVTAGAIALTGLLYLTQAPWRRAARRWAVDIVVTLASVLFVTRSTQNESLSLGDQVEHARQIAQEGAEIAAMTAIPFGTPAAWLVCGALAAVALVGAAAQRRLPSDDPLRGPLVRWLGAAVAGAVLAMAGWAVFAPAHWYYTPTPLGLANRVNVLAGIGLVTLVYAVLAVIGLLTVRVLPAIGRRWVVLPVAVAVVIGVGYVDRLTDDKRDWDRAFAAEMALIGQVKSKLPELPPGATVLTFGWPGYQAPGVPIFASSWDLKGAVQIHWNDGTVSGFPVIEGTALVCGERGIRVAGQEYENMRTREYGSVYLFDVPSRRVARPADQQDCASRAPAFVPGPVNASG